jgi:hypothetical protein
MQRFIEAQNIALFTDRLKTEADPLVRRVILALLASEQAKRLVHDRSTIHVAPTTASQTPAVAIVSTMTAASMAITSKTPSSSAG